MMRRIFALALTFAIACSAAHAEPAWPTKPIRILVGYAPGGSTDVTARIIAQALSERLWTQALFGMFLPSVSE